MTKGARFAEANEPATREINQQFTNLNPALKDKVLLPRLVRSGVRPGAGQIAVIKTLWTDRAFGKPEFWANTIHLEPSVGVWITARGVSAVAMDCFPEKPFWLKTLTPAERGANHKLWLKAGIPMIQMLTGLGGIAARFTMVALPLNLLGMDGAPARVIGIENA